MKAVAFVITVLLISSCGGAPPEFISPADGTSYNLVPGQNLRIDFAIKDYDRNVNISFRGQEALVNDIDCVGAPGLAYCQQKPQGFGGVSFAQSCDSKAPCTISAIADNGKTKSIISVRIQRGVPGQKAN